MADKEPDSADETSPSADDLEATWQRPPNSHSDAIAEQKNRLRAPAESVLDINAVVAAIGLHWTHEREDVWFGRNSDGEVLGEIWRHTRPGREWFDITWPVGKTARHRQTFEMAKAELTRHICQRIAYPNNPYEQ